MSYTVYVAGTFNVLTDGHKKLLKTAVDCMEGFRAIYVYITEGSWIEERKEVPVRSKRQRKYDVLDYLYECGVKPHRIIMSDLYRPNLCEEFIDMVDETDILVCSSETRANSEALLNQIPESRRPKLVVLERDPSMPSSTQIIKKSLERDPVTVVR